MFVHLPNTYIKVTHCSSVKNKFQGGYCVLVIIHTSVISLLPGWTTAVAMYKSKPGNDGVFQRTRKNAQGLIRLTASLQTLRSSTKVHKYQIVLRKKIFQLSKNGYPIVLQCSDKLLHFVHFQLKINLYYLLVTLTTQQCEKQGKHQPLGFFFVCLL